MSYDAVATYGCDPGQVAPARRWAYEALSQRLPGRYRQDVVEDAVLVVSELVTNAIRADCSRVSVGIAVEFDAVRVGVTDDADGTPQPREAATGDFTGRGLRIVAALARQWGVRPILDDGRLGKEVWARLALRGTAPGHASRTSSGTARAPRRRRPDRGRPTSRA